jgi:hypothetical protein
MKVFFRSFGSIFGYCENRCGLFSPLLGDSRKMLYFPLLPLLLLFLLVEVDEDGVCSTDGVPFSALYLSWLPAFGGS